MDYLKMTLEKIENASTEYDLHVIEAAVNHKSTNWSSRERAVLNARIADVRGFWKLLTFPTTRPDGSPIQVGDVFKMPPMVLSRELYQVGQLIRHQSGRGLFIVESYAYTPYRLMVNCRATNKDGSVNRKLAAFRFDQENIKTTF